ncbi:MAG: polyprenyl synthetase family protein [Anaerolineae bacterium]|nr:polyprenyl synthetase family protein [Anaerolineae bacterium]
MNSEIDSTRERLQQIDALIYPYIESNNSTLAKALYQLVVSGGKRIRPRLALLTGNMLGAEPQPLLRLAAAIEMLHIATLVHDDLIDRAALRRGIATLNSHWSSAATTLTGDFAFAVAAQLAVQADSFPVMRLFTETLGSMVGGEILQLSSAKGISMREDYYRWIQAKTASLFELAAGAAARLSQADDDVVAVARKFGHEIGMAFQIIDDVLDFTGQEASLGKPVGNDLRQGTVTLPALYYLEAHPDDPTLVSVIQRNGHTPDSLERLIATIRDSRAIERAISEAEGFVQNSLTSLEAFPETPERQALAAVARQIIPTSIYAQRKATANV